MRTSRLLCLVLLAAAAFPASAQTATYIWDDPEKATAGEARFPTTVENADTAAAFWQERKSAEGWPQSTLAVSIRKKGESAWTTHHAVIGPFTFAGSEAQYYSAVLTAAGVFWVAILDEKGQLLLYRSGDGVTFTLDTKVAGTGTLLVPRLFLGTGDEPLLLVNQADATTFRIWASHRTGGTWSALHVITDDTNQKQSFQPSVVRVGNRLTLVYQTILAGSSLSYQIFRKDSLDGGATWSAGVRLSDFKDEQVDKADDADNERPVAVLSGSNLVVAWERRTATSQPQIAVITYNAAGVRLSNQTLTEAGSVARNPQFFFYRNALRLAWFDNSRVASTYDLMVSAFDPDTGWGNAERLVQDTGDTALGQAVKLGEDLYYFYQVSFLDNPGVNRLQPDRRALAPVLAPVDFSPDVKRNKPDFSVRVTLPRDPSGIAGYSALLTLDPATEPPHERQFEPRDLLRRVTPANEGVWYLAVAVVDGAGNWSPASRIRLQLKTTPPGPVLIDLPSTDARGFLTSNTFRLSWKPTTSDAVAYAWRWDRVGDQLTPALAATLKPLPPVMAPASEMSTGGVNFEDGLWALSVAAFDEAGNRGPVTSFFFRLNKFVPSTIITSVDTVQDAFGRVQLVIHGRGFLATGALDHVYLDRDGRAPFDVDLTSGAFRVVSDRLVDGIRVEGLAEGTYRVGVSHPVRGRVFTGPVLRIGPTGTVKIGDFRNLDQTVWEFFTAATVFFSVNAVAFWSVLVLLAAAAAASARLLVLTWLESRRVAVRTAQWFADNPDKWAQRARRAAMKTRGLSLTFKFAASIVGLMLSVILILAFSLGFFITENSQRSLGAALQQRVQVLVDSMATSARDYLLTAAPENALNLNDLPPLISALNGEAAWATITGPSVNKTKAGYNFVWASNDPELAKKTGDAELNPGVSVIKDEVEPLWQALQKDLDAQADDAVGADARANPDPAAITDIKRRLIAVAGQARVYPAFDTQQLLSSSNHRFVFYQPVLNFARANPSYIQGLIRVEVSTDAIVKQITASRDQLIFVTAIVALIALFLGLAGALVLSALTVNPIRRLSSGVAKIRDTDDKTHLDGHVIEVRTRDELEDLASTVNEMTHSLVKGAKQSREMAGAKGLQKTFFIALDKDEKGNILTTYARELEDLEVFAYYEGAKTVSGDLYEFRQLDAQRNPKSPWYGLMKGDISGKGVEALLSMTIAASYVTNFFRRWTEGKDGRNTDIAQVLNVINDNLEPILTDASAHDGQQKFAALNIGILNAKTGELQFAQAGDNLLHLWRGAKPGQPAHFELMHLAKTAAAGLDDSKYHVEKYRNQRLQIERGDTLLYFTDGIEESQAYYRDADWNLVAYFDPNDASTMTAPGSRRAMPVFEGGPLRDVQATGTEDFGPERMEAVIEAYQHGEVYTLVKRNWFHPDIEYHFDFSACDGSARGLVLALISIDRIFRLVPDPKATEFDFIDLDIVEEQFLKAHFVEFERHFKDGRITYRQAIAGKENMDAEGFFLEGAVPLPVWEKGNKAKGDTVDDEGCLIVDGNRVQASARAGKGESADAEGYRLVDGQRVKLFEKGDPAKGDSISPEGYKLTGGRRQQANPGYIRYSRLLEDPQFDDLTLLAIRRK